MRVIVTSHGAAILGAMYSWRRIDLHATPPADAAGAAPRYAIYYAPPPASPWASFGAAWLGRDARTGHDVMPPAVSGLTAMDIRRWTAAPRRYGWHATLKPPFRLKSPYTLHDLLGEVARLAHSLPPVNLAPLATAALDRFVALRPAHEDPRIAAIARVCTKQFDALRAAPTADELGRRTATPLTPNQRVMLERWGYPYVMDEFRFHFTLTGSLPEGERRRFVAALAPVVATLNAHPLQLDGLAVFCEPAPGADFRLLRRYGFDGSVEEVAP